MGTCPKCGNLVASVTVEGITVNGPGHQWAGLSFVCPSCRSVLGVGIDPVALKSDTLSAVAEMLRPISQALHSIAVRLPVPRKG